MGRLVYNLMLVAVFFALYRITDIYAATILIIVAVTADVACTALRRRPVTRVQWIGLLMVLVLGGATLFFRNDIFIKWRPTGVYWLGGIGFLTTTLAVRRNPIQLILGRWVTTLSAATWSRLNWTWIWTLVGLGIANLIVAYQFSTDTWVNWRMVGAPGIIAALVVVQCVWLRRHVRTGLATYRADRNSGTDDLSAVP